MKYSSKVKALLNTASWSKAAGKVRSKQYTWITRLYKNLFGALKFVMLLYKLYNILKQDSLTSVFYTSESFHKSKLLSW